ncbi:SRPBCC family protein [Glycomyces albidus]|uniref:SRPBCC domain-containing protein n=1 Tax=Glycomyces albidus TaxID=2656774 RepID=A0A6L5G9V5_9ACTN|nr:SRPBCC domain-containing protein [Glycomyces albidus]MQM26455.1 SRPBCC domain-containing protein [Glycomyces albidus]
MTTETPAERGFAIARELDAPIEEAWRAWTDPESIKRWWGPDGWTAPVAEVDFREGGTTLVGMQGPQGPVLYNTWTYRRIEEPHRIEFDSRFADETGAPVPRSELGLPEGIPEAVPHVVTFEPLGDAVTRVTVEESGYRSVQVAELSKAGQEQVLDKMAALFER